MARTACVALSSAHSLRLSPPWPSLKRAERRNFAALWLLGPVSHYCRLRPCVSDNGGLVEPEDDKARFAAVVMPHLPDAYALARSLTGNRTDAEDVLQEACLRAFRALGTTGVANARAWLLTIVRNTAATWLGKNRSRTLVLVDDPAKIDQMSDDLVAGPTPEAAMIAKSDGALLERAVAALPAAFREVLLLHDVQGLKYSEIAEAIGVPIGTVMSRLARARAKVMATIGESAA
jgi:RNA polymerase sigma factor (sigma-70 family)